MSKKKGSVVRCLCCFWPSPLQFLQSRFADMPRPPIPLRRLRTAAALASLVLALLQTAPAWAGPPEGELFGYRIGVPYVPSEASQLRTLVSPTLVMLVDRPDHAADFKAVELLATPRSLLIVSVHGVSDFPDEAQARAFASQQAAQVSAAYAERCPRSPVFMNDLLKLACPGGLEISVSYYPPDRARTRHKVHLGLRLAPDSEAARRLARITDQEATFLPSPVETPQQPATPTPTPP